MKERREASYFEVVDLVDRVLPPKADLDYTQTSPMEIIEAFNEEVEKSGLTFNESALAEARSTIVECFRLTYQRKSNFHGVPLKKPAEGFDNNNYFIQNQISLAKIRIINCLTDTRRIIPGPGKIINPELLGGNLEELEARMTKDQVRNYVESVLTCSFEDKDYFEIRTRQLAVDILLHFGIKERINNSQIEDKIVRVIEGLTLWEREREYVSRKVPKEEVYASELKKAIDAVTGIVYDELQDRLAKREKYEEPSKQIEPRAVKQGPIEESVLKEGEETISTYENVARLVQETEGLERMLKELNSQIAGLEAQEAELKAKIASNKQDIISSLSK